MLRNARKIVIVDCRSRNEMRKSKRADLLSSDLLSTPYVKMHRLRRNSFSMTVIMTNETADGESATRFVPMK